jgi:uncharacterized protein (TIGR03790 family)
MCRGLLLTVGLCWLASAEFAHGLGPEDVYVLVNRNVPESRTLAIYYCDTRRVPADHILDFDLPAGEDISRTDYDRRLAGPLRERLKDRRDKVKVLLSLYGVPLRVGREEPAAQEKEELAKVRQELEPLDKQLSDLRAAVKILEEKAKKEPSGAEPRDLPVRKQQRDELDAKTRPLRERVRWLEHAQSEAAVDSELALLWQPPYELRRWQLNPLHFLAPPELRQGKPPVLMTVRLDGPSPAVVRRMIDQAIAAETRGLAGRVYLDARGIKYDPKADPGGFSYGAYDESLREAANLLRDAGFNVTLDDRPELFGPGTCPDCALYCGWYSLAKYVPCCKLVPGAVAYHIASAEAVSLRDPKATYWCKKLLDDGAAATLGPVAEPYLAAFPRPEEFFGFLATGKYTLVECYWRTSLVTSWMMVLVGDPLYNPFASNPKLAPEKVKPSPAGSRITFEKQ